MSRVFFIRGKFLLKGGGKIIFIMVRIAKNIYLPKKSKTHGALHTRGGWTEYLTITNKRLVLASVPIASFESFFHQGLKHTIKNFIKGILRFDLIHHWHMPHSWTSGHWT